MHLMHLQVSNCRDFFQDLILIVITTAPLPHHKIGSQNVLGQDSNLKFLV